jgi:hypothetical protein
MRRATTTIYFREQLRDTPINVRDVPMPDRAPWRSSPEHALDPAMQLQRAQHPEEPLAPPRPAWAAGRNLLDTIEDVLACSLEAGETWRSAVRPPPDGDLLRDGKQEGQTRDPEVREEAEASGRGFRRWIKERVSAETREADSRGSGLARREPRARGVVSLS